MRTCNQCGEPLKEFSKFCFKCGKQIDKTVSEKLILDSLSSTESQKLFLFLNSRLNMMERKVDSHLEAIKRIEKILLEKNIVSPDAFTAPVTYSSPAVSKALDLAEETVHEEKVETEPMWVPTEELPEVEVSDHVGSPTTSFTEPTIVSQSQYVEDEPTVEEIQDLYTQVRRRGPQLPKPELFSLDAEYYGKIDPVPEPTYTNRTTRIVKRSLKDRIREFIEYQAAIAGAVISFLAVMLLGAWVLFKDQFNFQSLSLSIIGGIMIGFGYLLVAEKFKKGQYNLGIAMVNFGFLLAAGSLITLSQSGDTSIIFTLQPYLVYALVVVLAIIGIQNGSNITAMNMSFFVPLLTTFLSWNDVMIPLLYGGGILWYIPLATVALIYGIREHTFYPSILLGMSGLVSVAAFNSAYVGGYSLAIAASILPLSILLDRGKVELLRPYLIVTYLVLFLAPLGTFTMLFMRNMISVWDTVGFILGITILHQISTVEITRGGFKRSILFTSVIRTMQKVVRYTIPLNGLVASVILGQQINSLDQQEYYFNGYLPSILFILISLAYTTSVFLKVYNKPSKFEIFVSVAFTEVAILVTTGNLAFLSARLGNTMASSIFAMIALILPLVIGIAGQYLFERFYYASSFILMSNWLTVLNSFILVNVFGQGSEVILYAAVGLVVFPLAIVLPQLTPVQRRQNYEVAIIANGISILVTQLLGNYNGVRMPMLKSTINVTEYGPFIIFALFVFSSGVAFNTLSRIVPKRVEKLDGVSLLVSSRSEVIMWIENILLRYQELSFSLFINVIFAVFAFTGGFAGADSGNVFLVIVLVMLIPVNLVTMYLSRGRHWATIIPSLLPFIVTSSIANDILSLNMTLISYSTVVILTTVLVYLDKLKGRTDLRIRTTARDISIWTGLAGVLYYTNTVDPLSYLGIIMVVSLGSALNTFMVGKSEFSGVTLAVASFVLQVLMPGFSYSLPIEISLRMVSGVVPLVMGSLVNLLMTFMEGRDSEVSTSIGSSLMVLFGLFLPWLDGIHESLVAFAALFGSLMIVNIGYVISKDYGKTKSIVTNFVFVLMGFQGLVLSSADFNLRLIFSLIFVLPAILSILLNTRKEQGFEFLSESMALGGSIFLAPIEYFEVSVFVLVVLTAVLAHLKYALRDRSTTSGVSILLGLAPVLTFFREYRTLTMGSGDFTIELGFVQIVLVTLSSWLLLESFRSSNDALLEIKSSFVTAIVLSFTVLGGVPDFTMQTLMVYYLVAIAVFELKTRSVYQIFSSLAVLVIPLFGFGTPEVFNLLIFYLVQALIAIINLERKRVDNITDATNSYYGIIILSSLYALLAPFGDSITFMVMTTVVGLVYIGYEVFTEIDIKPISLSMPVALILKLLQVSFSSSAAQYMVDLGIKFMGISASIQLLMAVAFLAYSRTRSSTPTEVVAGLSFIGIVVGIYGLFDTVIVGLPLLISSYLLWRSSSERNQVIVSVYQLLVISYLYFNNPAYAATALAVFVINFVVMTIQVVSTSTNIYSTQKLLMGINMILIGTFVEPALAWKEFAPQVVVPYLDYVWLALLIFYDIIVVLDVRSGGFNLFDTEVSDGLGAIIGKKFTSLEDTISLLGIIQSAVFVLWVGMDSLVWIVPILAVQGLIILASTVTEKKSYDVPSIQLMVITMGIQVVTGVYNVLAGGFLRSTDLGFGTIDIAAIVSFGYFVPLIIAGIGVMFSNFSERKEPILTSGAGIVISVIALVLALIASASGTPGVFPAIIALSLLGVSVGVTAKESIGATIGTLVYYVSGMIYGQVLLSAGYDLSSFLGVSMNGTSVILLALSTLMYFMSIWIESSFDLGESFGSVVTITILVFAFNGLTATKFVTGAEKMLTFMSLAFSSSMSYWYGIRYSRDRIRDIGLLILTIGFIGGIGLAFFYAFQGTLDPLTALFSFVSAAIAFLFVLGVRQINRNSDRKDILRIFLPKER